MKNCVSVSDWPARIGRYLAGIISKHHISEPTGVHKLIYYLVTYLTPDQWTIMTNKLRCAREYDEVKSVAVVLKERLI